MPLLTYLPWPIVNLGTKSEVSRLTHSRNTDGPKIPLWEKFIYCYSQYGYQIWNTSKTQRQSCTQTNSGKTKTSPSRPRPRLADKTQKKYTLLTITVKVSWTFKNNHHKSVIQFTIGIKFSKFYKNCSLCY